MCSSRRATLDSVATRNKQLLPLSMDRICTWRVYVSNKSRGVTLCQLLIDRVC